MKMTPEYAARQLRYYQRVVAKLRQTSDASDAKEKEQAREDLPPKPPIGEKEQEKESSLSPRAREELPPSINFSKPPTLSLLLAYAHTRCRFFDDDYTREWYRIMSEELDWKTGDGHPILHWGAVFRLWRANRKRFEEMRNPTRTGTQAAASCAPSPRYPTRRHANNWRPMREEDISNVLG